MRKPIVLLIVLGSLAVAVVGFYAVRFVVLDIMPAPYERVPSTPYKNQIAQTLAAFDSGNRATFDALYPHESSQYLDAVWNSCSDISQRGRVVTWPEHPETPTYVGVPISGVSKKDTSRHVSCAFDLDAAYTSGWWDIYQLTLRTPAATPSLP